MPRLPYAIEVSIRRARRAITPARAVASALAFLALLAGLGWMLAREARPAAVGAAEAPSRDADAMRLATFDLDELYDERDDAGGADDVPTPTARLREIADLILRTDADILALQGVESREALEWFRNAYIGAAGYTHIASLDAGHERGLESAILSRYPIRNPRLLTNVDLNGAHPPTLNGKPNPFAGIPLRFHRAPLCVDVDAPRAQGGVTRISLIIVDARGGNAYEYWRNAEAVAIAEHVSGLDHPVAILGAFHAEPGDPSVETLLKAGFIDAFEHAHDSAMLQTETSGDRTTLVLVNPSLVSAVRSGFVLAPAEPPTSESDDSVHLPVVAELDASKL